MIHIHTVLTFEAYLVDKGISNKHVNTTVHDFMACYCGKIPSFNPWITTSRVQYQGSISPPPVGLAVGISGTFLSASSLQETTEKMITTWVDKWEQYGHHFFCFVIWESWISSWDFRWYGAQVVHQGLSKEYLGFDFQGLPGYNIYQSKM